MITDYMIIGRLRGTDTTPSFGYVTVATITISAILTVIMTLRTPRRRTDDEPHQDPPLGVAHPRLSAITVRAAIFHQSN
ncbi:MAG TPA: hypothetical protein VJW23_10810 [Propionibacteriaceae bacterium]|nr:hypothetical protein [Propionibacteriaceae bacterium]